MSDDNLYKIINVLTRIRKDGSQHRDVIATEWFASYKERSYNSHMARCNSPYQDTALVACPALKVQEHQEMMEYLDEYDDDYSDPPMLKGWFIVWMFGDVTRDDVTSKMYG